MLVWLTNENIERVYRFAKRIPADEEITLVAVEFNLTVKRDNGDKITVPADIVEEGARRVPARCLGSKKKSEEKGAS